MPVTGEYHITLADGSKLWVNSNTRVNIRYLPKTREIEVDGEVYLEVKKDGRPFRAYRQV
ncbi:MAG: FecR domain-containing protein [Butyricimonas faecihominis]